MALAGAALATVTTGGIAQTLQDAPARPPVDAPELAKLGAHPIGVADAQFVQPRQADPTQGATAPVVTDRVLPLKIWYPAAAAGPGTTYHTALSGENGVDIPFDVPGLATPGLAAATGRFPLVILAHGYGNTPEVLSWLGENLASKGYVVVAPAFRDPPISIRTAQAHSGPIARRPLDIAFVAAEAQRRARAGEGLFAAADADRTALIGYSMGGYGVLTAAGAPLNPALGDMTRGVLSPYAAGGAKATDLRVAGLKAVVAISPANRFGDAAIWSGAGLAAITTPTLFVVGGQDHVVGYPAVRALFDGAVRAPRYLLTFKEAAHSIALVGAPPAMRHSFWDLDWFEDAVWRKDRLLPVEAHFITAFLDRHVKGDASRDAYLDGLVADSDSGRWATAPIGRYAGYSPGPPAATTWKGFQPSRATGMMFETKPAR
ncbi:MULTISPECIES: dienelactone hydrolase [unclassified Sphingomonas]|uniref:alpha/beta hydrolase family protein n=1 Tax=unclassified Sphingomonas TaxID=196159 RepID=UPI002269C63C